MKQANSDFPKMQSTKVGQIRCDYPVGYDESAEYCVSYRKNPEEAERALKEYLFINGLLTIGDRLAFARKRRGLNHYQLSMVTGISAKKIRSFERGGDYLGNSIRGWIKISIKLCDALKLSFDFLLGRSFTLNGSIINPASFLDLDDQERKRFSSERQLNYMLAQLCYQRNLKPKTWDIAEIFYALIDDFQTLTDVNSFILQWECWRFESEQDAFRMIYERAVEKKRALEENGSNAS